MVCHTNMKVYKYEIYTYATQCQKKYSITHESFIHIQRLFIKDSLKMLQSKIAEYAETQY